jgi:hypothetical protein
MRTLSALVGHLGCWLGVHSWMYPAHQHGFTLLLPTQHCRRCGKERDIRRDS